jgi:hypothetical protein
MTTRLKLYKAALRICGERTIASLTEDREPRRLLDEVWDDGGVDACLASGQWDFATRTSKLDYDASITPEFGYRYAFQKPTDWIATLAVSTDEYFNVPLNQYTDEQGYWYCDEQFIYVQYVSNHADWGGDLSSWPQLFTDYAGAHFALKIIRKLTSDDNRIKEVAAIYKEAKLAAKNHDAQGGPTRFPPQGSWTRSRQGSFGGRRDRGSRGSLIG